MHLLFIPHGSFVRQTMEDNKRTMYTKQYIHSSPRHSRHELITAAACVTWRRCLVAMLRVFLALPSVAEG